MKNKIPFLLSFAAALLFAWLFYNQEAGINLALFVFFLIGTYTFLSKGGERSRLQKALTWAVLFLSLVFAFHGSYYTLAIFFITTLFWLGSLSLPGLPWIIAWPEQTVLGFFQSQYLFVQRFYGTNKRQGNFWWPRILIGVLFLVIILIFLSLYSSGNAIFASATQGFWNRIETFLKDLNGPLIFTCIAGLFIANWVIFRNQSPAHDRWLAKSLSMIRTKGNPENTGLRSSLRFEYRTGIVLFALLNGLLLLLNLADIWLVWLGFEWKGQLLKDFVHEGTWNLIFSIFISSAIMLFYFRGKIALMTHNRTLLSLAFIWIAQNLFLAVSLMIRNGLYISHYGLAYKRIGIFFFLAGVCVLLFLLLLKIRKKDSMLSFANKVAISVLGILVLSAVPDWSQIITRYNFAHYKKSYVHLEFLADMPDRCLPAMSRYRGKLGDIQIEQDRLGYKYSDTVAGISFSEHLDLRIKEFNLKYAKKQWQEFVWADRKAYVELNKGKE